MSASDALAVRENARRSEAKPGFSVPIAADRGTTRRRMWHRALPALLAGMMPAPALAQDMGEFLGSDIPFTLKSGEGTTVADRPHTELEPLGIHTGSFVFFPSAVAGLGYTTNVYGQTTNPVGDGYVEFAPQAQLVSQWSRDLLEFSASSGIKEFFSQTVRSEAAYSAQADGRIDLGQSESNIVGLVHYGRAYEAQYSGSFPKNAAGTIGYDQADSTIRSTFVFNRLRLIESERVNDLRYQNATSLNGQILPQQYRDRTEYDSTARLEYAFTPDFAVFGEGAYNFADYHVATVDQPLRSNHTIRVIGGVNFDLGKLIRLVAGIGYEERDYDLAFYTPLRGVAFDVRAQWLVTELTTLSLQGTRKAEDAINANSPGYWETIGQFRIDHELLRYVLLQLVISKERDSFVALSRTDTQNAIKAGAIYSLGRHFKILPTLWYIDRSSVGLNAGQTFKEVRFATEVAWQW
jgi:hypothetical protein